MNRDVFLSILAMDAYNRGYGQNLLLNIGDDLGGQRENDRKIGKATVLRQSNVQAASGPVEAGL
jgi:hypothetical protein